MTKSARVIIEVVAGVLPGTSMPEHTKEFNEPASGQLGSDGMDLLIKNK